MLISPAYAQGFGGDLGSLSQFLPLVLIFGVFYFILLRPQQKKMRDLREMLAGLKRGDKVVTGGGLIGTVIKVFEDKDEVIVELAKDVRVSVVKSTIQSVLTPAEGGGQKGQQQAQAQGQARSEAKSEPANDPVPPAASPGPAEAAPTPAPGVRVPSMQAAEAPPSAEGSEPPPPGPAPGPAPKSGSWRTGG